MAKERIYSDEERRQRHVDSNRKYEKDHCVRLSVQLNIKTDADIIEWIMKQASRAGALKKSIRYYIKETSE